MLDKLCAMLADVGAVRQKSGGLDQIEVPLPGGAAVIVETDLDGNGRPVYIVTHQIGEQMDAALVSPPQSCPDAESAAKAVHALHDESELSAV